MSNDPTKPGSVQGLLTLNRVIADGVCLSASAAVRRGIITSIDVDRGYWAVEDDEVPVSHNVFVDGGRQLLSFIFGGRSPLNNYICQSFGVGTGDPGLYPPNATDVALVSPVALASVGGAFTKPIDGVDFPAPFIARVQLTLAASDANGYLVTEFGLFSGDGTLLARTTNTGINKSSESSYQYSWKIRF